MIKCLYSICLFTLVLEEHVGTRLHHFIGNCDPWKLLTHLREHLQVHFTYSQS